MADINDIARIANVSITTVSRVLNNRKGVSESTKNKVLKIMEQMNYTPNAVARALVRQRTDMIGVVVNNVMSPFYSVIIKGIEAKTLNTKYGTIFINSRNVLNEWDNEARYKQCLRYLAEGRVDGIIIAISNGIDKEDVEFLISKDIPFVVIQDMSNDERVSYVNIDNYMAAYRATKYLIELGHRNIAHITGSLGSKIFTDRLDGFVKALQDHNIEVNRENILQGDISYNDGYWRMKQIMSWNERPTAIFCSNDVMAYGAIQAAKDGDIRIPEDISIIGFDGIANGFEYAGLMRPLTTMQQPMEEMGQCAAQIIMNKLDGLDKKIKRMCYDVKLMDRGSCKSTK